MPSQCLANHRERSISAPLSKKTRRTDQSDSLGFKSDSLLDSSPIDSVAPQSFILVFPASAIRLERRIRHKFEHLAHHDQDARQQRECHDRSPSPIRKHAANRR
ncbi:conserved hypothetical protein [Thiomonas sp. X19]|nr:conserved hypothetical protein [Thiomonas sp. X19]